MLLLTGLGLSLAANAAICYRYRVPPRIWNRLLAGPEPTIPDIPLHHQLAIDGSAPRLAAPDVGEPADLAEWKARARAKLIELLGIDPPIKSVSVRTVRMEPIGNVMRETLVFEEADGVEVPAFLLRPLDAPPRPGVIVIPGHSRGIVATAGIVPDYQHSDALHLAQAGYVVLTMEVRGFGYLAALDDREPAVDRSAFMGLSLVFGTAPMGVTVRDAITGLDYLETRTDVAQGDLAAVGFSSGCTAVLYLAAIDTRVRATVASGCLSSHAASYSYSLHDPWEAVPGVAAWLETCDIAGLISPRPLLVQWGELDNNRESRSAAFNPSALHIYQQARRIFEADGAADRIAGIVSTGMGHEFDNDAATHFLRARLPFD